MSRHGCPESPEEQAACRQKKPYGDVHHLYWPRRDYDTKTEKAFRELPENKEFMCRCAHNLIHATERPPEKPSLDEMRAALGNAALREQNDPE